MHCRRRPIRLITYAQLCPEKGIRYTRRHLRDLILGGRFPKPVHLSTARIAWIESEIDAWLAEKIAKRDAPGA